MNKSQTILAAIGGTAVAGALVLGYFIWDASSAKSENADKLDAKVAEAKGVMRKLPFKAEAKELKVFKDNAEAYGEWRREAEKIASRGDLFFERTTPAVFKMTLVDEARRIAAMPGCLDGKFAKGDFGFGFKDYVTGGAMPPENEKDLKRLQREWNDVAFVLKTLAECGGGGIGVSELTVGKAQAAAEEEQPAKQKRGKAKKRAKAKAQEAEAAAGPEITAITVEFLARPSALVKALNAFTTGTRFVVVEKCAFVRESDALASALGGDGKGSGERSSRKSRKAQKDEKAEAKAGFVIDPATAPMLKVTMAVSVYDFGTLEKAAAEVSAEKPEEAKKGESK